MRPVAPAGGFILYPGLEALSTEEFEKGDDPNTYELSHVGSGTDWELVDVPATLKMSDHVKKQERRLKVTSMKHVAATCP